MSRDWHRDWCPKNRSEYGTCKCHEVPPDVLRDAQERKDRMKKNNPKKYRKLYCGL